MEKILAEQAKIFTLSIEPGDDKSFKIWQSFCRNAVLGQTCIADVRSFSVNLTGAIQNGFSMMHLDIGACSLVRDPHDFNDVTPNPLVFYFVLDGRVCIEQDGRSILLQAGDATLCAGERPFTISANDHHTILTFKVNRQFLSRPSNLKGYTALNLSAVNTIGPIVSDLALAIWTELPRLDVSSSYRLVRHMVDIAETTLGLNAALPVNQSLTKSQATLCRIKAVIESNLSREDLDSDFLAAEIKLTARYINKLFNTEGTSLFRYIWNRRIQNAAQMLLDSYQFHTSITDIAFALGFKNISHFSDMFRRAYQVSPTEFRNIHRPSANQIGTRDQDASSQS